MEKFMQNFEKFSAWSYDNGLFYFSGRDVYCILLGVFIAIVSVLFIWSLLGKDGD